MRSSAASSRGQVRQSTRGPSRLRRQETFYGWLFISPVIVALAVFSLGPIIASLYISVMKTSMVSLGSFVGLANYQELLFKDDLFWQALKVSAIYALVVVPVGIAIQLTVAAMLNHGVRGISLFRLLYYLPNITPAVALIIVWMYIYNPGNGLANTLLRMVGLPRLQWLQSVKTALPSFMIMAIWGGIGPGMVLFLAGLQGISESYYEAAALDGAGSLAKFWHITVPLVSPVTFFSLVLGLIGALQTFDSVYIATRGEGGPLHSTLMIGLYIYRNAFLRMRFGYASAVAWALALVVFALTFIQMRLQNRWVHYGG